MTACYVKKIWDGEGPDCLGDFKTCLVNWCMMEKVKFLFEVTTLRTV